MQFKTTVRFEKNLKKLPVYIRKKFYKQLDSLLHNIQYPSLNTKKIQGCLNIWEARVDYQYRFTFSIDAQTIILRVIGNHDEVLKNP